MEKLAEFFLLGLLAYFVIGLLIAIPFLTYWIRRLDESADGASFLFRPMIFFGCVTVWPFILIRILSGQKINQSTENEK